MKKFWLALGVAIFFYAKTDILIWQRIFEANGLYELGIGTYHWGWFHSLIGFMALGMLVCYPSIRRMILFPISLAILAFSGLEDILYYWLDSKPIPGLLPWLNENPLIIKPVTNLTLLASAAFWVVVVVCLYIVTAYLERQFSSLRNFICKNLGGSGFSPKQHAVSKESQG
jgi:hypothetical protein